MGGSIGPLVAADEFFNHQIVDTQATVLHSDYSWTEKVCGMVCARDGSCSVNFGFGKYHGQWRGPLVVEGDHFDDCSIPESVARLNQFRDCLIELRASQTNSVGIGNCQTWVQGRWPELGLPDG